MPNEYRKTIPGKGHRSHTRRLRQALRACLTAAAENASDNILETQTFPFVRFFEIFAVKPSNLALREKLERRLGLVATDGSVSKERVSGTFENKRNIPDGNRARPIDDFVRDIDPEIENVGVYMSRSVKISASSPNERQLTLSPTVGDVLVTITDVPSELGFGERFHLSRIELNDHTAEYTLEEEDVPTNRIILTIDFRLDGRDEKTQQVEPFMLSNRAMIRMVATESLVDSACTAKPRPPKPPDPSPQCVRIHIRRLEDPTIPVNTMLQQMNTVYSIGKFTVTVLSNVAVQGFPQLLDVDVGTCSGQTTAEQNQLFGIFSPPPDEIVVYFVRSTVPPANGCASHPNNRPACIVARGASQWTLAHEIGHVLGLTHVNDNDRLMTGNGTFNITNPPADIVDTEIRTMRQSPLTSFC